MTPYDAPDPRPGTVAEEAALLVDLLSQRGWGGGSSRMPSPAHHGHATSSGGEADEDAGSTDGPTSPNGSADSDAPHDRAGSAGARSECTCGGTTPAACRVCPVCQLIAFVQQVNPDTIDRVADFVGFAATALRDLATAQRERRPEPGAADTDARTDARTDTRPETSTDTRPETSTDGDRTRPGDSA